MWKIVSVQPSTFIPHGRQSLKNDFFEIFKISRNLLIFQIDEIRYFATLIGHKDDKSMAVWQTKRESSRSRIRDLSTGSDEKACFRSGERRGRSDKSDLKDFGLTDTTKSRLSKLDDGKKTCSEPGCDRSFSTKIMLGLGTKYNLV